MITHIYIKDYKESIVCLRELAWKWEQENTTEKNLSKFFCHTFEIKASFLINSINAYANLNVQIKKDFVVNLFYILIF